LAEFEEFAEALFGQLEVELNEEKEIKKLADTIDDDPEFKTEFDSIEKITQNIYPAFEKKVNEFLGLKVRNEVKVEYPELEELKNIKGKKVFCSREAVDFVRELFDAVSKEDKKQVEKLIEKDPAKYLVYSTYAIQYTSKITTTYGDYLDSVIYLNKFILSRYPKIILYKQGAPYDTRYDMVNSGYIGALKMTILEELIHSTQEKLHKLNKEAAMQVNSINEELARIILDLDDQTVKILSEYLQLQAVPDEFPFAKKANLFFFLNPDHFLIEQIGTDVMTYTNIEIDPKMSEKIAQLLDIYQRWLKPIQQHHAAFTAMEGMAGFAIQNILKEDQDFNNYLTTFMGTDLSSYQVRKSMGIDFTKAVYDKLGKETFGHIIENPPDTKELKDPKIYLNRSK